MPLSTLRFCPLFQDGKNREGTAQAFGEKGNSGEVAIDPQDPMAVFRRSPEFSVQAAKHKMGDTQINAIHPPG
jgi:hypothetical protein